MSAKGDKFLLNTYGNSRLDYLEAYRLYREEAEHDEYGYAILRLAQLLHTNNSEALFWLNKIVEKGHFSSPLISHDPYYWYLKSTFYISQQSEALGAISGMYFGLIKDINYHLVEGDDKEKIYQDTLLKAYAYVNNSQYSRPEQRVEIEKIIRKNFSEDDARELIHQAQILSISVGEQFKANWKLTDRVYSLDEQLKLIESAFSQQYKPLPKL